MITPVSPRRKRRLARLQVKFWQDAHSVDMRTPFPLQMYKHLRRINLPRYWTR